MASPFKALWISFNSSVIASANVFPSNEDLQKGSLSFSRSLAV